MHFDTVKIFPTTIYIGELPNHEENKKYFYNLYPKYDYEETEYITTVSEECGNPLLHLEPDLEPLFKNISLHIKNYIQDTLLLKDVFDITITKTWLSRTRNPEYHIPAHTHSSSHISFVYYINIPKNSHKLKFLNIHEPNSLFSDIFHGARNKDSAFVNSYNEHNAQSFSLTPEEGTIIIFPSKLPHGTEAIDENFKGERLAIVGDCSLILKEDQLKYSMGYVHEKYWKKF